MITLSIFTLFAIVVAMIIYSRKDSRQQQRINYIRHRLSAYKRENMDDTNIEFKDDGSVDVSHLTELQIETIMQIFADSYERGSKSEKTNG